MIMSLTTPGTELVERVRILMGGRLPTYWTRAERGYTAAARWSVTFSDGSSVFVKAATTDPTAEWLRVEHDFYSSVHRDYLPQFLGWDDDGTNPILVLEDLSQGYWPPPWSGIQIDGVLEMLADVRATAAPSGIKPIEQMDGWDIVAEHPTPFLKLGITSELWLNRALPILLAASEKAELEGDELVHLDVRSDNVCFQGDRTLLVDWNTAGLANGKFDVAFWLPSLHAEGGPKPEDILPDEPELAAVVSGFFAAGAGLPIIPDAPRVRVVQLQQLRSALPWVSRRLGLPSPW